MSDGASPQGGAWDADQYARHAGHHRAVDDWFLQRHAPRPTDVVVDAGCGTGSFTRRLAELVPDGRVIGVEPDPSMLAIARQQKRGNVEYREGRVQDLAGACGSGLADLVVSRAVLHWIPSAEHPRCYEAVLDVLRPGAWFHAEFGGTGNVARLVALLDDVAARHGLPPAAVTFPDAGQAFELAERAGFHIPEGGVATVAQRRAFDRDALVGFLRTQASLAYVHRGEPDRHVAFLADAEARVDELRRDNGTYDQTFVRLEVLAQRPA